MNMTIRTSKHGLPMMGVSMSMTIQLFGCGVETWFSISSEETGTSEGIETGDGDGDGDGDFECEQQVEVKETQEEEIGDKWSCSLSEDIVSYLDIALGDQVRMRNNFGHEAVFTFTKLGEGTATVELTSDGFTERLPGTEWIDGCAITRIVPTQNPDENAVADVVESIHDPGYWTDTLLLAIHGGQIEPQTDAVAIGIAEHLGWNPMVWVVRGFDKNNQDSVGAFDRWFVAAEAASLRSFPGLQMLHEKVEEKGQGYQRVISIIGHKDGEDDCSSSAIFVGGGAPPELRISLHGDLEEALENLPGGYQVSLVPGDACAGRDDTNVANRFSECGGIQLSLGEGIRTDEEALDIVAGTVAQVLDTWSGCV